MEPLVVHPQATYTMRVRGESMRDAGIFDGDVLLVDRAVAPRHGVVVIAVVDGEFTCKQLIADGRDGLAMEQPRDSFTYMQGCGPRLDLTHQFSDMRATERPRGLGPHQYCDEAKPPIDFLSHALASFLLCFWTSQSLTILQ
jgi:hypothetical protein